MALAVDDPSLAWWTIETSHFRVHYPSNLQPVADRVAALAESIHDRLTGPTGYDPKSVTHIVLTDDVDDANGSATSLPFNTVRLYVTAPGDLSALGDYDDWYLELLTHEYTHILHTDNTSGIPAIVNGILGKTLSPNQVQPRWIIEGLAVYHESRHSGAGRMRSSLFDMFLRADVLGDNIASLDQLSSNAQRYPQGNLWYLYGSRFLGWISDIYGPDTMRAVAIEYGSTLAPWQMNRVMRRVTGRTYEQLYDGFKDYLRRHYAAQAKEVRRRGLREGRRITDYGGSTGYPRFVPVNARTHPDREELVFFRNDLDSRSGVYRLPFAEIRQGKSPSASLLARTSGSTTSAFTHDGGLLFSSLTPYKNTYSRRDLYTIPRGETSTSGEESSRKRLTTGLRANDADVSPDGRTITYVINGGGTSTLRIADLSADGEIANARDLVRPARFDQAYTPRFSPDGRKIAYSVWTRGGYRDVRIVDARTGSFVEVAHDRAMEMQPVWSPDGETLYFSSDRSGIFNIYALSLADFSLRQVTNVILGATQPAISQDGKTLVYVGYGVEGYDLYTMALDPARYLDAPAAPDDRPSPPEDARLGEVTRSRYNPLTTLAPRSFLFNYKPGSYGDNELVLSASGSDVLGHHSIGVTINVDPGAPEPTGDIAYTYGRLPVNLSISAYHSVAPRTNYRIGDTPVPYDEIGNGITTGVSLPLRGAFSSHSLSLQYRVKSFEGRLPIASVPFDPYSKRTALPPQGIVSTVHLGYGFSNVEGSLLTAGPARGVSLSAGLDYGDEATASQYSYQAFSAALYAYIPMPWPGHHTLAMRTAGAIAGGAYARNGIYYVGGYDLENVSLIDSVTTGALDGAFVVRGYPARSFVGRQYLLQNLEYRFPIVTIDHGISTLPVFLRRIDGNVFLDYGGAFNSLDTRAVRFFHKGYLIDSPDLHASAGAEIWMNATFGYYLSTQFRLGYVYGFSNQATEGGQLYFVAASAY